MIGSDWGANLIGISVAIVMFLYVILHKNLFKNLDKLYIKMELVFTFYPSF